MATVDTEQGTRTQADQRRREGGRGNDEGRQQEAAARQAQEAQQRAQQEAARQAQEAQQRAQQEAEAATRQQREAAARQARAAAPAAPPRGETYEYPAELPPRPADTGHALDGALRDLIDQNLTGENTRRSIGQATMPFLIGAGAEITRPITGFFTRFTAPGAFGHTVGTAMGAIGQRIGDIFGSGAELQNAAYTFGSTGAFAAVATGVLSPTMSLMKRALLGENAWKQASTFVMRAQEGSILKRILWGGESRAMKWSLFRENAARSRLLRLADQNVDVATLRFGNKNEIENLVAEGMVAGATAQMLTELNVPTDKDTDKMARMVRAYEMSKKIFDAKITTAPQKEKFINDKLPGLVRNKERAMWARQTALITGVGMLKSVSMVGLLQVFTIGNLERVGTKLQEVAVRGFDWAKDAVQVGASFFSNVTNYVRTSLGIPAPPAPAPPGPVVINPPFPRGVP